MVLSEEQVRKEPGGRQDGCSLNSGYACATATRQKGKGHEEPRRPSSALRGLTSTLQTKELWKSSDQTFPTARRSPTSQT